MISLQFEQLIKSKPLLIFSGINTKKLVTVTERLESLAYTVIESLSDGEWCSIHATPKANI